MRPNAAHCIGRLAGFDFDASPHLAEVSANPEGFRERALQYLETYCLALLASRPMVLLLEDLHWADDSSLDALVRLVDRLRDRRLMVLCTARPSFLARHLHWCEGQPFHTRLTLGALPAQAGQALVDEILQKVDEVPASLRELVVQRAEGNPFFVEELIKILIEDGIIVTGEERWRVEPARLNHVRVPDTLAGVLQARFDSLAKEERVGLQRASVVGRVFWDSAVYHLGDAESEEVRVTAQCLDRLRSREMILRRDSSAVEGAREYLFKHALLRDVTYSTILKRLRRRYHAQVAQWLEATTGQSQRSGEYAVLIAEHYEQAGEPAQAAHWYWHAAQEAAVRYANNEAVHAFSRALELTPPMRPSASTSCWRARRSLSCRAPRSNVSRTCTPCTI